VWNPTRETRSAMAFSLAAAVALLGSALLLDVRRALQGAVGGARGAPPEFAVVAVAVLLAAASVLLLAMAGKALVDLRRRPHAR
jgi:hypothetical protein